MKQHFLTFWLILPISFCSEGRESDRMIKSGMEFMKSNGLKFVSLVSYNSALLVQYQALAGRCAQNGSLYFRVWQVNHTQNFDLDSYMLISTEGRKWVKYSPSINQTIPFSTTVHLNVCTKNERLGWGQRKREGDGDKSGCHDSPLQPFWNVFPKNRSTLSRDIVKSGAHKLFHSIILQEQKSLLEFSTLLLLIPE